MTDGGDDAEYCCEDETHDCHEAPALSFICTAPVGCPSLKNKLQKSRSIKGLFCSHGSSLKDRELV